MRFIDSLPKTGMSDALAASDACIAILKPVPLYRTAYPNKVFDYLAAGRPVVLAMQGVIRKLVEEAGCGIPVEPGDPAGLAAAIRSLADDQELCAEMGQNGRAYLERHLDRPVLAGQFEQLLQHLAGTSPARETSEA